MTVLGYAKASQNIHKTTSIWHMNNCIVMAIADRNFTGLTGLGITCSQEKIDSVGALYDNQLGWYVLKIGDNFNLYLNTEEGIPVAIGKNYKSVSDKLNASHKYPNKVCGLIMNNNRVYDIEIFNKVGFNIFTGQKYNKIFRNRDFKNKHVNNMEVLFDTSNQTDVPCVIKDTPDIFSNIATYAINGVDFKKYNTKLVGNFGKLTHKINGYNCLADGNQESHNIEKMILNTPYNTNTVLRQRKQKIHICEKNLKLHYDRA